MSEKVKIICGSNGEKKIEVSMEEIEEILNNSLWNFENELFWEMVEKAKKEKY